MVTCVLCSTSVFHHHVFRMVMPSTTTPSDWLMSAQRGGLCLLDPWGLSGKKPERERELRRTHPLASVQRVEGCQAAQADAAAVEDGEEAGGGEGPDVGAGALQQHALLQQHTAPSAHTVHSRARSVDNTDSLAPSAHAAERGQSIQYM